MVTTPKNIIASWADAWIDALAQFSHPGRMRRGRQFANRKHIAQFVVRPGEVLAQVKEGNAVYDVHLEVEQLDDETWDKILSILASRAIFSARLLAGEMPKEVVHVFDEVNAPLFPRAEELHASCTCVDWQVPCKHLAGLYYWLADRFEEDPFLLFQLRGRSKDDVLTALRSHHLASQEAETERHEEEFPTPTLLESLNTFWDIGESIEAVSFNIKTPSITVPHLRRLGAPTFTQLDLINLLSPIYQQVTEVARKWAYQETD
ncbi:MAG: hypothetical protein GXP38_09500 [Chloroflexi bacterium]|nr:hypothetical protein [Chloroflexota bacterium]